MNKEVPLKEIVTVTEMARMCRLSRARFYQLIDEGIFPEPSRNEESGRPLFDREQQEQCLAVRRTNKGANGKAVMFYGYRLEAPQPRPKRKQFPISRSSKGRTRQDPALAELRHHGRCVTLRPDGTPPVGRILGPTFGSRGVFPI